MHEDLEGKHGVQSLEVGMSLLKAMVGGQRAMMLRKLWQGFKAKAHRLCQDTGQQRQRWRKTLELQHFSERQQPLTRWQ